MRRRIVCGVIPMLGLLVAGLLCVGAQAQPQDPAGELAQQPSVVDEQRRQSTLTAGVMLLIGVLAIGLLLIAAAVVWGAKVRRLARDRQRPSARQDELWYLRKSLPAPDSSDRSDETSPPLNDQHSAS